MFRRKTTTRPSYARRAADPYRVLSRAAASPVSVLDARTADLLALHVATGTLGAGRRAAA